MRHFGQPRDPPEDAKGVCIRTFRLSQLVTSLSPDAIAGILGPKVKILLGGDAHHGRLNYLCRGP